ncbi:hypothetical protein SGLAM104S_08587 [Streptomyces glaucescens]
MVEELLGAVAVAGTAGVVYVAAAARVVKQYERGVVFRLAGSWTACAAPGSP